MAIIGFFLEEVKMKKLILLLMFVSFVGAASATTVWNPAANGIFPPAVGNWGDVPSNWTNGLPDSVEKAVFNVPGAAECQVIIPQPGCTQLVMGDGNSGGVLRIMPGGTLTTCATWSAIGYNDTAHMIVEAGGTASFGGDLWVGAMTGAYGILDISGTVNVAGMLGIGWFCGYGEVNVLPGGILNLEQFHHGLDSIRCGSTLDISGDGMVTLPGDFEAVIAAYAANGLILGNGIPGAVQTDTTTNPGFTTVTAVVPVCVDPPTMDTNDDCRIDLTDLAVFVSEWLTCGLDIQSLCW